MVWWLMLTTEKKKLYVSQNYKAQLRSKFSCPYFCCAGGSLMGFASPSREKLAAFQE